VAAAQVHATLATAAEAAPDPAVPTPTRFKLGG
jgi:hypothetical protein